MARPNQEAIDTFISVTGCTHSVAVQRLEAHSCDLNQAINAHYSQGDRSIVPGGPDFDVENSDMMDLDDPLEAETQAPFPGRTPSNPFSVLDPEFRNQQFDQRVLFDNTTELADRTPSASHPSELGQIPSEIRDGNELSSTYSGHVRATVDVTDAERSRGLEIPQIVSENNNVGLDNIPSNYAHPRPSAPGFDAGRDDHNDIEEEMIRAAIEASKKDADPQMHHDLDGTGHQQREVQLDDPDLAHAVSLSLKAAEQERSKLIGTSVTGDVGSSSHGPVKVDELGNAVEPSNRPQSKEATSSSTVQDQVDEQEEPQLVRHRSGNTSGTSRGHPHLDSEGNDVPPVGLVERSETFQNQLNGNPFTSDEWGGMSSVEHDEAVMLEAAMFGGIPEQSGYNFPYASHHLTRAASDRTWQAPRPPSPGLTAQRLIREQQDDEYLASLQADREKELKALEEERAAKEAALEEEKRKEEDARRKLEEEQELERLLASKEASLSKEPAVDDENAVTLLVRLPDGSRRGRRFLRSDKLESLFDFIDVGRGVKPGSYRLVRPYPRQAFSDAESMSTLKELGLMSKQEALFLEPK